MSDAFSYNQDQPFYKEGWMVMTDFGKGTVLRSFKENGDWMYEVQINSNNEIHHLRMNRVYPLGLEEFHGTGNPYVLDL